MAEEHASLIASVLGAEIVKEKLCTCPACGSTKTFQDILQLLALFIIKTRIEKYDTLEGMPSVTSQSTACLISTVK